MYVSYIAQIMSNLGGNKGNKGNPIQPFVAALNATLWVHYGWYVAKKD